LAELTAMSTLMETLPLQIEAANVPRSSLASQAVAEQVARVTEELGRLRDLVDRPAGHMGSSGTGGGMD
jgi:hypothetical protein